MDASIPNKLKGRCQELIALVFEVELGLVSVNSVQWKFIELTSTFFFNCPIFTSNITLNCHVILKIFANYSRRNLSYNTFECDVGLQCWLEVLNDTWLSHFKPGQIDNC